MPFDSLQCVFFGALFHDIGKMFFKARAFSEHHPDHVRAGLYWTKHLFQGLVDNPEDVYDAIRLHHGRDLKSAKKPKEALTWITYEADNLASATDRRESTEDDADALGVEASTQGRTSKGKFQKDVSLQSVFNRIQKKGTDKHHHPVSLLEPHEKYQGYIPMVTLSNQDNLGKKDKYEVLVKQWEKEVNAHRSTFIAQPNTLLFLMEALLGTVTSDTGTERIPDISLYDHLKLTAAIACCMHLYGVAHGILPETMGGFEASKTFRTQEAYALVALDVSGIQKFIYQISSKGALRSLKARSFFLEILMEHVIDELLVCASKGYEGITSQLNRAQVIYSGGGKAYLLLPHTPQTQTALTQVETRLNRWFWEETRGMLSIAVALHPMAGEDLMDTTRQGLIGKAFQGCTQKLAQKKWRRFVTDSDASLLNDVFAVESPHYDSGVTSSDECAITRVDHHLHRMTNLPGEGEESEMVVNRQAGCLYRLGKALLASKEVKALWVERHLSAETIQKKEEASLTQGAMDTIGVRLPDLTSETPTYCWLGIVQDEDNDPILKKLYKTTSEPYRLYGINRLTVMPQSHANLWVGNYLPKHLLEDERKPITFEDLAQASQGDKKLGVFRADVDNLGSLFSKNLDKKHNTFSRCAAISRQLSLFFKLHLNSICAGYLSHDIELAHTDKLKPFHLEEKAETSTSQGRNVIIVYSGGDDVFIMGAWHDTLEVALDIQKCFEAFTNGTLTLSGGFQMFPEKYPVYAMAKAVEDAEEKAKAYVEKASQDPENTLPSKNALCAFPASAVDETTYPKLLDESATVLSWEKVHQAWCKQAQTLHKQMQKDGSGGTLLYRVYQGLKTYTDVHQKSPKFLQLVRLAYTLKRAEKANGTEALASYLKQWLFPNIEKLEASLSAETLNSFYVPFVWVQYFNRSVK
jgi:CRISPR-associated protein Csm1